MTRATDMISPEGLSIPALFRERVGRTPASPAFHYYDRATKRWLTLSWRQMENWVSLWRRALHAEKLSRGDRVALMLPNGPDWACFDLAAQSLGLVPVPLYANDRPDNVAYILESTETKILLCPGLSFWEGLHPVMDRLTAIRRVITVDHCRTGEVDPRVVCITDWLPESGHPDTETLPDPDELATIVFTSGTTGRPKGVMLSHRNILANAAAGLNCIRIYPDDLFLSFLPLSHMLERMAGYYLPIMAGASIAYARSIQELSDDLAQIKPTVLVAVPKIFERLHSKLLARVSEQPGFMQALFRMTADTGWRRYLYDQGRGDWSADFLLQPLLDAVVGRKVRARLGGRLRVVISGGAPLSFNVARNLIGLGLRIYQGYGLTETSPVISVNREEDNRPEGVGRLLPGIEGRVAESGELLVRGPSVMLGYWQNPEATAEAIDSDHWLHTGDQAELADGHLKITGRLKEIIVLSNSEKVSPSDMETAIAFDPLFEQSMVVGEGRPYLTLLLVLNRELWNQLAEKLGLAPDETSLTDDRVREEIFRRTEHCLHAFPGFAWVKEIHLSLEPWTVEQGLVTPTLKLRRKNVLSAMHNEIEQMYRN